MVRLQKRRPQPRSSQKETCHLELIRPINTFGFDSCDTPTPLPQTRGAVWLEGGGSSIDVREHGGSGSSRRSAAVIPLSALNLHLCVVVRLIGLFSASNV